MTKFLVITFFCILLYAAYEDHFGGGKEAFTSTFKRAASAIDEGSRDIRKDISRSFDSTASDLKERIHEKSGPKVPGIIIIHGGR